MKGKMVDRDVLALKVTAYHEAAHVVVALALGIRLLDVGIHPTTAVRQTPSAIFDPDDFADNSTLDNMRRQVAVTVAGQFGELLADNSTLDSGHYQSDTRDAMKAANLISIRYPPTTAPEEMARAMGTAKGIIFGDAGIVAIQTLAAALMERGSLSGTEVESLLDIGTIVP